MCRGWTRSAGCGGLHKERAARWPWPTAVSDPQQRAKAFAALARRRDLQPTAKWLCLRGFNALWKRIPIQFLLNCYRFLAQTRVDVSSPGSISPWGWQSSSQHLLVPLARQWPSCSRSLPQASLSVLKETEAEKEGVARSPSATTEAFRRLQQPVTRAPGSVGSRPGSLQHRHTQTSHLQRSSAAQGDRPHPSSCIPTGLRQRSATPAARPEARGFTQQQ